MDFFQLRVYTIFMRQFSVLVRLQACVNMDNMNNAWHESALWLSFGPAHFGIKRQQGCENTDFSRVILTYLPIYMSVRSRWWSELHMLRTAPLRDPLSVKKDKPERSRRVEKNVCRQLWRTNHDVDLVGLIRSWTLCVIQTESTLKVMTLTQESAGAKNLRLEADGLSERVCGESRSCKSEVLLRRGRVTDSRRDGPLSLRSDCQLPRRHRAIFAL